MNKELDQIRKKRKERKERAKEIVAKYTQTTKETQISADEVLRLIWREGEGV